MANRRKNKSKVKAKRRQAAKLNDFAAALSRAGFGTYEKYLDSPHWSALKHRLLLNVGCISCRERATVLHHVEYGRLGFEIAGDLMPLCHNCHEAIHRVLDERFPKWTVFHKARQTVHVFETATGSPLPAGYSPPKKPLPVRSTLKKPPTLKRVTSFADLLKQSKDPVAKRKAGREKASLLPAVPQHPCRICGKNVGSPRDGVCGACREPVEKSNKQRRKGKRRKLCPKCKFNMTRPGDPVCGVCLEAEAQAK